MFMQIFVEFTRPFVGLFFNLYIPKVNIQTLESWICKCMFISLRCFKQGLLGSMHSIADKLLVFCTSVLSWLLSNASAPKAGQNFEDLGMQFLIMGTLILYHISFYMLFLPSKFKDGESIDGVLFKFNMWLLPQGRLRFFQELIRLNRISLYLYN